MFGGLFVYGGRIQLLENGNGDMYTTQRKIQKIGDTKCEKTRSKTAGKNGNGKKKLHKAEMRAKSASNTFQF